MATKSSSRAARRRARVLKGGAVAASAAAALAAAPAAGAHAFAHEQSGHRLVPGSLVVSGTVFPRHGVNITAGVTQLPDANNLNSDKTDTLAPIPLAQDSLFNAVAGGNYPYVFNNAAVDGSFGVETPILLWDQTPNGQRLSTVRVPAQDAVTSFESKSELGLSLSTDGKELSFSGYEAPLGSVDASNASTPGVPDPSNPDVDGLNAAGSGGIYRVAVGLNGKGQWTFTETNSYSGNNERSVILDSADNQYIAAGNAGNGNFPPKKETVADLLSSDPVGLGIVNSTGMQDYPQSNLPEADQNPTQGANIVALGGFDDNGTLPYGTLNASDKLGKTTNFRGLAVYNNVVYMTKGSGSNGDNTVYFLDTTGTACGPNDASGLPVAGAPLPAAGGNYQICILKGFSTTPATDLGSTAPNSGFPFGLWFANPTTLYVADEGNGGDTYDATTNTWTDATAGAGQASSTNPYPAGLQKWSLVNGTWTLDYTLQNGLNLGQPYVVPGYPTGINTATQVVPTTQTDGGTPAQQPAITVGTGLPWAPATDGLRNLTGRVNGNGTVTLYAATSTVSGSGDQGGDPNKVVAITDTLGANDPAVANAEQFRTVDPARFGVRYGGVAIVPSHFDGNGFGN